MDRRTFIASSLLSTGFLSFVSSADEICAPSTDIVSAEATFFSRYEHYHNLSLPLSVLINPPVNGYKTRTTLLDQESLDKAAFDKFIKESGLPGPTLQHHYHDVLFSQEDLVRIASGEKNVEIVVLTPKKNLAHRFYFTVSAAGLIHIKRKVPQTTTCNPELNDLVFETIESPFFEHYHRVLVPTSALVNIPSEGLSLTTSPMDQGSYDLERFEAFVKSSKLSKDALIAHKHSLHLSKEQLQRLASGEKDMEVRVISDNGNYVHNFKLTASPSALAKIKNGSKK